MDIYGKIAEKIKEMSGGKKPSIIFTAEVMSVSESICSVSFSGLVLTEVKLRAVINSGSDMLLITPQKNSQVLVADLSDGEFRELAVIGYSEISSVKLTIGTQSLEATQDGFVFNGGELGGVANIETLTEKINELADWCKNHKHGGVITSVSGGSGAPAVGVTGNSGAPTSQPTRLVYSDFEDTKLMH